MCLICQNCSCLQLEKIGWCFNLEMGQSLQAKMKSPHAVLELGITSEDSEVNKNDYKGVNCPVVLFDILFANQLQQFIIMHSDLNCCAFNGFMPGRLFCCVHFYSFPFCLNWQMPFNYFLKYCLPFHFLLKEVFYFYEL